MSKNERGQLSGEGIQFLGEQIGDTENEFKASIVKLLRKHSRPCRAYLAQIKYAHTGGHDVALCIASNVLNKETVVDEIASVFRRMFGSSEHLDILFLNEAQETQLRLTCCPFFTSERTITPDFYLVSSEGFGLEKVRQCYKERRFMNGHPDGYMQCEIRPHIIGQPYGLGDQNINKIVLANRYSEHSLFSIENWPAHVHVARYTRNISDEAFVIGENDIEAIGWAQIYATNSAAKSSIQN